MTKQQRTRWIIGGTIILIAAILVGFLQFGENVVYFYTPSEAQAKAADLSNSTIRLGGMVMPGSVKWQAENLDLRFTVSDLKGHEISVAHRGTPPDMFKEGQGVVVEGRLSNDGKAIQSKKLMVKHSEEYKKQGDHTQMDKAALEKSMFKD